METKLREVERTLPGHWKQSPTSNFRDGNGCLLGHLAMAYGLTVDQWDTLPFLLEARADLRALAFVISEQYPEFIEQHHLGRVGTDVTICWRWNDVKRTWGPAGGRTEAEVIAVVEKARVMLECEI